MKDMISSFPVTEQQKNVEQTKEAKKAYGKRVSALDASSATDAVELQSVGGHMFKDTRNTDRSNDRVRKAK